MSGQGVSEYGAREMAVQMDKWGRGEGRQRF